MQALKKIIVAGLALGLLGAVFVFGLFVFISFDLPQIATLNDYNPPIPSRIYSRDNELLLEIGTEKRTVVPFDQIPKRIVNSFLAAEDDNFYNHKGVDYYGVLRAMLANIKAGKVVQGGSTITQQVAKSLLLSREKTIVRKVKDFLLAQKIEKKFSKEDILFLYLNQVYLGGGYYGVKRAFKGYFGKELDEATIAESALIAGLLVAPGKYSPYVNPRRAKLRQNYVLKRLFETQKITKEEYDAALSEQIKIQKRDLSEMKAGYFTDWIRQRVMDEVGVDNFLHNGFTVKTTIDWSLQKKAEQLILENAKDTDKRQGFKGPIKTLEGNDFTEFLAKQRQKLLDDSSNYFMFKTDGTVEDQFVFNQEQWIEEYLNNLKEEDKLSNFEKRYVEIGHLEEDRLSNLLKVGKSYEAVVLKVSDSERMVFASIAGQKVIIPYEYYRWAHERYTDEDRKYFPYVIYPSNILKTGDVVLVKLQKLNVDAWSYTYSKFKEKNKSKNIEKYLKEGKYHLALLDQEPDVQSALLSMNPHNGEILSMVGGTSFEKSQFNRAVQSNRQPGSSFKPFIYAAGLENNYTPASILLDSPQALGGVDSSLDWKPRNYDGEFKGEMTFRKALEVSRNIPTILLLQDIGVEKMIAFSKRINLNTTLPEDLSISLGSFGLSLLDLVKAYSIFPNGGQKVYPKSVLEIKDRFGQSYFLKDETHQIEEENLEVVEQGSDSQQELPTDETNEQVNEEEKKVNPFVDHLKGDQVYDRRLAYLMCNLLKGVVQNGTGRGARHISSFIGGKTGTTNSYVDALFMGFSSNVVTGVWTGFDDNHSLGWGETGAKAALPVWRDYMQSALARYGEDDFNQPTGIVNMNINSQTGRPAKTGEKNVMTEAFVEGTEPGSKTEEPKTDENTPSIIIDDDEYYSTQ